MLLGSENRKNLETILHNLANAQNKRIGMINNTILRIIELIYVCFSSYKSSCTNIFVDKGFLAALISEKLTKLIEYSHTGCQER